MRPLSLAERRFSYLFVALWATFPVVACQNAPILQSSRHLELGVRFSTHDPRVIRQVSRALKRWSEIADLSWHRDESNACSIDVEDGTLTGDDEIAEASADEGLITFGSAGELTAQELFFTAFHEIGHLLGLEHNPSPHSVMYWMDIRGDEVLDDSDMRALAARHVLRDGSGCRERGSCEILSRAFDGENLGSTKRTLGTNRAAWQSVSSGRAGRGPNWFIQPDAWGNDLVRKPITAIRVGRHLLRISPRMDRISKLSFSETSSSG